jgi:hypothetical protein
MLVAVAIVSEVGGGGENPKKKFTQKLTSALLKTQSVKSS